MHVAIFHKQSFVEKTLLKNVANIPISCSGSYVLLLMLDLDIVFILVGRIREHPS